MGQSSGVVVFLVVTGFGFQAKLSVRWAVQEEKHHQAKRERFSGGAMGGERTIREPPAATEPSCILRRALADFTATRKAQKGEKTREDQPEKQQQKKKVVSSAKRGHVSSCYSWDLVGQQTTNTVAAVG